MRIAVTGASGHLGANVVRELLDAGHGVRAVCEKSLQERQSLPGNQLANLAGLKLQTTFADVLDRDVLIEAFQSMDAVIHLAARISIDGDRDGLVWRTNVDGTRNVAAACLAAGVARLVHVSSIHAYRSDSSARIDEASPQVGADGFAYDRSKVAGEAEIRAACRQGLDCVILNPTGILGPYHHAASPGARMLDGLFTGNTPALVDAGFDWVDARDVAIAVRKAITLGRSGENYLLPGRWIHMRELSDVCASVAGRAKPVRIVPLWTAWASLPYFMFKAILTASEPIFTREALIILRDSCRDISSAKAERDLGYTTRPIGETIADTYAWRRSVNFTQG